MSTAIDSGIYLLTGNRQATTDYLIDQLTLQKRDKKYLFLVSDRTEVDEIKQKVNPAEDQIHSVVYSDLPITNSADARGRNLVLLWPAEVLENYVRKGDLDGGILRLVRGRSRRSVLVVTENGSTTSLESRKINELPVIVGRTIHPPEDNAHWLEELVLALLYKRHPTTPQLIEDARLSVWWTVYGGNDSKIADVIGKLRRLQLVERRKGRLSCSAYGRFVVEREIQVEKFDRREADLKVDVNPPHNEERSNGENSIENRAKETILEFVKHAGWCSIRGPLEELGTKYPNAYFSPSTVRRLLDSLLNDGLLQKGVYNRGKGRPLNIFFRPGSDPTWLGNRCGDCVFYIRSSGKCRLWWSVSRFSGKAVFGLADRLPRIAQEKLRYGVVGMGPNASSCLNFLAKKRDYPIRHARDRCLACDQPIELPIAKLVACTVCGTKYKPTKDRILVLYNHEKVFRDAYQRIVGAPPPVQALYLPTEASDQTKDVIVFYPGEKVTVGSNGLGVKRGNTTSLEGYYRIHHIVDYGALSVHQVRLLGGKGVSVTQRRIQTTTERQGRLKTRIPETVKAGGQLTKAMAESLILSVIAATKRILDLPGPHTSYPETRAQLIEYLRLKQLGRPTLDQLLAFEARTNYHYWAAYKRILRIANLDFKSRVRERFVRELVSIPRARARGYSPANAAINYLHQRRLAICANINSQVGLPNIEGLIHVSSRSKGLGLLLDLSDQFKLADRERFLERCLKFEVKREDFVSKLGRQHIRYYYPSVDMVRRLEEIGRSADEQILFYEGREMSALEAYRKYASSMNQVLTSGNVAEFEPLVYGAKADLDFVKTATNSMVRTTLIS